ncbi:unnamed protein product, partial [Vitis vinifera]
MLHRAATNAYSWWWASHIRTKQSKWLEQNLHDVEEKVQFMLKIIDDDGDSFAQRAEMYYRKRPELINLVEEYFRAYRAIAERYDHLSRELQHANRTIATVYPEKVQFAMDDEEENKDFLVPTPAISKRKQLKKTISSIIAATCSGLSKTEALDEIDKIQKEILMLQTEKEFVKSSYERGAARYWEIESQITEMQSRVSDLQDEFGIGTKQERVAEEARHSQDHETLSHQFLPNQMEELELSTEQESLTTSTTVTAPDVAERIDELVEKVITLEAAVSSQTALVRRLRLETNELQTQVRTLEENKETLIEDSDKMSTKLIELEEELSRVQSLNRSVEDQNKHLQTHFTEASYALDHLSEKLQDLLPQGNGSALSEDMETHEEGKKDENPDYSSSVKAEEENFTQYNPVDSNPDIEDQDLGMEEGDQPNWRQLFINGLEHREKALLDEYTSILRSYKEIRSLRQNISPQTNPGENWDTSLTEDKPSQQGEAHASISREASSKFSKIPSLNPEQQSTTEEKIRADIDDILEENLEFWLRFSTSYHQIQKFQTSIQDLQAELLKLKEDKKNEGGTKQQSTKSDARPIYTHMREIQTELTLWLEHNALLKEELQGRFSSLCNLQEEISRILDADSNAQEAELSYYQAAKFQGELLNMKQENKKVKEELQKGLDRVRALQLEVERTLSQLDEDFEISKSKSHPSNWKNSVNRTRIPLRSFLFGVKLKKQKPSFFACMSPTLQKQYSDLTAGLPP